MKASRQCQQGLTLISFIFLLGAIGTLILLIFNIAPIYIDHSKVTQALKLIKTLPDIKEKSSADIRSSLDKQLSMNYVYDVKPEDITILKHGDYLKVQVQYEVVKKLVGNLSVLAEFNDVVEVGQE